MVLKKYSHGMVKIKVRLFANFREFTKKSELEMEGETVRDILNEICRTFEGIDKILMNNGNVSGYVNIFLNGINVLESDGLDISLKPHDELAIFPPVSGG